MAPALAPGGVHAQAVQAPPLTLEDIYASATFFGNSFQGGRWAAEGPVVTYIETTDRGATHLMSFNLETGDRTRLIDGEQLQASDVGRLIAIEDYTYSEDGSKVLLYTDSEQVWRYNTKGLYYVYDVEAGTLQPLSDRDAGFQMFAKMNPQGTAAAFVRDRNLFHVDLATMDELQLTFDGADGTVINGTSDWVYEEEFGLRDAWAWSPDGQYIAFLQLDETNTRDFAMADLRGQYPDLVRFRYPKAGEQNSEIRLGLIELTTKSITFADTDTWYEGGEDFEYIPQFGWTPPIDGASKVWLFRLNRDQNDLDVLYVDPATASTSIILEEQESTWIEVETGFSDLEVGQITYLDDQTHFVWISERDGFRHLYLYENDGTLVRQLTQGSWDVTDFHGLDEDLGRVYFTATTAGPLERHLYRMPMDGPGEAVQITRKAGWHSVNLSSDLRYYIDSWSDVTTPTQVTLHTIDGEEANVLEGNERLRATMDAYDLPAPAFMQVEAADGTALNAWMIRPDDFDSTQTYPLLMFVYGGPGSQTVQNRWGGQRMIWHQYLAREHGFLVASVDNRGTGGRGKAFKSATYKQLGVLEAEDQIAAAQQLADLPYVDAERIGLWGWSYGGFMTLNALLMGDGPETFSVGVSVAPVTDWRQYDTIYTERYMSTPQNNPEGYRRGAPITYADRLDEDQDLLIIHGDLDDNVHFQNAVQMAAALQAANKQFDFMVYPGRNHGIYGGITRLHLFTYITNYLTDHLAVPVALP
ncbi:MAG: DPP IV N-terminal domain-containing protein [Bacteroidota bacterium]